MQRMTSEVRGFAGIVDLGLNPRHYYLVFALTSEQAERALEACTYEMVKTIAKEDKK